MNDEADTKVTKKPSRFASRMAKKRSKLDRKLSKMKSKLRDVEQRKDEMKSSDAKDNQDQDEKPEVTKGVVSDSLPDKEIHNDDIKEEDHPKQEQDQSRSSSYRDALAKTEEETGMEAQAPNKTKQQSEAIQAKSTSDKESPSDANSSSIEAAEPAIEDKSPEDETPVKELAAKPEINKSEPKQAKEKKSASIPKPAGLAGVGGLGLSGRGNKKVKPAALLQKIVDRLDDTGDLQFVSKYRNAFLAQLKNLHNHTLSISWYCSAMPEELAISGQQTMLRRESSQVCGTEFENQSNLLSNFVNSESLGSLFISSWSSLLNITPVQAGNIRQYTDIHIIQSLPDQQTSQEVIPLLERVSRQTGSLIIAPLSLKADIESLQHQYEIHRGYTVIENDRIGYVDVESGEIDISWLSALLENPDASGTMIEFSMHRNIMRVAQMLAAACDKEISTLTLIEGLKSPTGMGAESVFSIVELDALMKNVMAKSKLLFGAKGIKIDDMGHVTFAPTLSEGESAQALISELSIDDMVREDELNALKFGASQRKSIDRIQRFRFASKLGFLWKLKPEYIEHLHLAISDIVISHTRNLYKQVTEIVDAHLEKMSVQSDSLAKNSSESSAFKRFKSSWNTDEHVVQAISKISDLNHFRAVLFSKRGNAAPLEAQQGVLKELRESRMFVSQLMAFGMLGAVLLGSSYAVDVLGSWLSGGASNIGDELIQASKSSRGLGRQVRILIAGVAGIGIVFYLGLRMYLRTPEKILDQQRIVDTYSQQLEEVVSGFIVESSNIAKEIIGADLDRFQLSYDSFNSALPEEFKGSGRKISDQDGPRSAGPGQTAAVKRIAELNKWLVGLLSERDSISIIQAQKAASTEAQQQFSV